MRGLSYFVFKDLSDRINDIRCCVSPGDVLSWGVIPPKYPVRTTTTANWRQLAQLLFPKMCAGWHICLHHNLMIILPNKYVILFPVLNFMRLCMAFLFGCILKWLLQTIIRPAPCSTFPVRKCPVLTGSQIAEATPRMRNIPLFSGEVPWKFVIKVW